MKVCLVNNLYKPYNRGGAEAVLAAQKRGFEERGDEVFVISLAPGLKRLRQLENEDKRDYYLRSVFPVLHAVPIFFRLFWHLWDFINVCHYFKIKKILAEEKPELIITHNLKGMGMSSIRLFSKESKQHIHVLHDIQLLHPSGLMLYGREKALDSYFSSLYQSINRYFFKNVKNIISPSQWLIDLHGKYGFFHDAKKLQILNPLSFVKLSDSHESSQNEFRILLISHVTKAKGVHVLLEALRSISSLSHKKIFLTIAGRHIDKTIDLSGGQGLEVEQPNFYSHKELAGLLQRADCLVSPSLCHENSPNAIYQAAWTGVPVVASNVGGVKELISVVGGELFSPGSSRELGSIILKKINGPSERRSGKAGIFLGSIEYVREVIAYFGLG